MDSTPYRSLSPNERSLLERLLEPQFPGRDELRAQLDGLVARQLDDEGCLAFECHSGVPAAVKHPIPTEGDGPDVDGVNIHVMLQVADGYISSLVMAKESATDPTGLPDARTLKVFAAYSEDAGVWDVSEKFR